MRIGSEVGHADDHDRRGVVVDSHPERGWLVWWCGEMAARWHRAGAADLWERPPNDLGGFPFGGIPAGALLRLMALASEEAAAGEHFEDHAALFRSVAVRLRARGRNLVPDAYNEVCELALALHTVLRFLASPPQRLDYLVCRIGWRQPDWLEPLKRRPEWFEAARCGNPWLDAEACSLEDSDDR